MFCYNYPATQQCKIFRITHNLTLLNPRKTFDTLCIKQYTFTRDSIRPNASVIQYSFPRIPPRRRVQVYLVIYKIYNAYTYLLYCIRDNRRTRSRGSRVNTTSSVYHIRAQKAHIIFLYVVIRRSKTVVARHASLYPSLSPAWARGFDRIPAAELSAVFFFL